MLEQDSRIKLLFGDVSLPEFVKKLPSIALRPEVHNDVAQAFGIIHKLLCHAYFEYLFIDVAVGKALHTLEMALKIRYKEITFSEWKKNAPLHQLLEWFRSRSYFERDDPDFFAKVKNARNYLSHPTAFRFGGTASLHWIDTTIGLVNDVYDDLDLRKERKVLVRQFDEVVNKFLKDGAKIKGKQGELLLYGLAGSIANNKSTPVRYSFALLPLFDPSGAELNRPIRLQISDVSLFNSRDVMVGFDTEGFPVFLSQELTDDERSSIKRFRERCRSEQEFAMAQNVFFYEADTYLREEFQRMRLM